MNKKEVLASFGMQDPFDGFTPDPNSKLWGWNGDSPLFGALVEKLQPKQVIEVGSWMGQSSCNLASSVKRVGLTECSVICIDTWLGSLEHWVDPELRAHMKLKNGFPTFYYDFLSNVANLGLQDVVVPMPMPSLTGAALLKKKGIKAELIYIDGSHETLDVYNDLEAYWPLLAPGGIIFGDDWGWESVSTAVKAFSAQIGSPVLMASQINWCFQKPS